MHRRAIAITAPLFAWSFVGPAAANETRPPLTLDWNASPDCSSGPQVLADVAHILTGSWAHDREVTAHVRLVKTERGAWSVVLMTETDSGARNRSFDAESCEAAAAGVAFILAVALKRVPSAETATDQSHTADGAATADKQPVEEPTDLPSTDPPEAPPPSVVQHAPSRPSTTVFAFAAGAIDAGTLPRATLGATAAVGLQPGRWLFDVSAGYWSPQSATAQTTPAGARFQAFSAEARAAYGWPFGRLAAGLLAGVGIELISAEGFKGSARDFAPTALTSTFCAGGFASWRWGGPLGLRLEVEGEVPFSRPSFIVIEAAPLPNSPVFRLSAIAARTLLGADAYF
jgi:hypothetical protein